MQHDGEYCFVGLRQYSAHESMFPAKRCQVQLHLPGAFIGPSREQNSNTAAVCCWKTVITPAATISRSLRIRCSPQGLRVVDDPPLPERLISPEHIGPKCTTKEEVDKYFAEVMKGYRYKDGTEDHSQDFRLNALRPMPCGFIDYSRNRQQAYSRLRRRDRSVILPNRWSRRKPLCGASSPKKDGTGVRAQGCKPKPVTAGRFFKA